MKFLGRKVMKGIAVLDGFEATPDGVEEPTD